MNTNDALTTTTAQVETILTDHSVTYTTTDNRGGEDGDYRITVGDVTAYFSLLDDGDVWATTDENPADAYDGPANADEIALHLLGYAAEVPAVVAVIAAVMNETAGDANVSYWDGYWEVEDSHTTIEVDTDGDWEVTQSDVDGIEWSGYAGRNVAAVFRAGALAYAAPRYRHHHQGWGLRDGRLVVNRRRAHRASRHRRRREHARIQTVGRSPRCPGDRGA